MPVLAKGFSPPIVSGFSQYLSSEGAKELMENYLEKPSGTVKPDPFGTHPTLDERLAALKESPREGKVEDSDVDAASAPALSLLSKEAPDIEQEFMAWIQATQRPRLTPVSWAEVGQKVWRLIWKEGAAKLAQREMDEETWRELCRNAGISDLSLYP